MVVTRSCTRKSKPPAPSSSPSPPIAAEETDIAMESSRMDSTSAKRSVKRTNTTLSSKPLLKISRPRKKIKVDQTLDVLLNRSYQRKAVDWSAIHARIKSHPQEVETKHLTIALMITKPTVVPPKVVRDLVKIPKKIFTYSALQFAFTCPWIEDETIRALIDVPTHVRKRSLRDAIEQSLVASLGPNRIIGFLDDDLHGILHIDDLEDSDSDDDIMVIDDPLNRIRANDGADRSELEDNQDRDDQHNAAADAVNGGVGEIPDSALEGIASQIHKHAMLHEHSSNLLHTLFKPSDYLPPRFEAVKIMLECIPKVLEMKDTGDGGDRDLPLHSACWSSRNSEYIELFIDRALGIENPVYNYGGLLAENRYGKTPLQFIVQKWDDEKGAEMIKKLVNRTNMSGDALSDSKLLHEAVKQKKWSIAKTIIEASPTSLSKTSLQGRIPLHEMCIIPHPAPPNITLNTEVIQFMIEQGITHLKDHTTCGGLITEDWHDRTPMSMLSSYKVQTAGVSMNIMKDVLKFIHSKRKVNTKLYLSVVIHEAIKIKEWELVTHIIERYPKSLLLKDKNDNLPIHSLCKADTPFEVIKVAIEKGLQENVGGKKKRAGLLEANKANERPLELIVARKCTSNSKVLRLMQDFKPKLITKKDVKDLKLLHKVADGGRSPVARMLLRLVPNAISIKDDDGNLPLHVALKHERPNKANRDLVKMLIEYGVKEEVGGHGGLMLPNNNSETPLDYVLQKLHRGYYGWGDRKWSYMTILLNFAPNTPILQRAIEKRDNANCLVESIVEKYPKCAKVRDESGRLPLQVALNKGMRSYCVKAIMDANPAALEEFECLSGLPCFALTASKSQKKDSNNSDGYNSTDVGYTLTFGYKMLLENPTYFSSQQWGVSK